MKIISRGPQCYTGFDLNTKEFFTKMLPDEKVRDLAFAKLFEMVLSKGTQKPDRKMIRNFLQEKMWVQKLNS